jgi:hypothetical protein
MALVLAVLAVTWAALAAVCALFATANTESNCALFTASVALTPAVTLTMVRVLDADPTENVLLTSATLP